MKILTAADMRQVEAAAVADGLDYLRLMENAGSAAARIIRSRYELRGRTAVVLCGRGNNGGDGFVIARKLFEQGAEVTVALLCGAPASPDAREMFSRIEGTAVSICNLETEPYVVAAAVRDAVLIVDAVYGIGFHGRLPDHLRTLFRLVNSLPAPIAAVDVPSGFHCDTGEADEDTLRAACTITFTTMKPGLLQPAAADYCGAVEIAQIGIDPQIVDRVSAPLTIIDRDMVSACFPPREADSHKGTYGHVLAVCGSVGMAGAALLAAKAALRCGAGLVTAALPRTIYPIVGGALAEALCLPLPETAAGTLALRARGPLRQALTGADALLLGCGLGRGEETGAVVADLLAQADCPIVLDADGINHAAGHIDIQKTVHAPLVMTPHPGEMARLLGLSIPEVQADRAGLARRYAEEQSVVLVLKGHHTLIAAPGEPLLLNLGGNPGMATGGSGDVLAGMIAAFLAQGMAPYQAAMCGVYLHAAAGDAAAARLSQHAMLPSDMIGELGGLFLNMEH